MEVRYDRMKSLNRRDVKKPLHSMSNDAIDGDKSKSTMEMEKSRYRRSCLSATAGSHLVSVIIECEAQREGTGDLKSGRTRL